MQLVVDALESGGHEVYCPLFDARKIALQRKGDTKAIFDYAFEKLAKQEALVAIVASERKSEGQLMEIGAALSHNQPVYVFQHTSGASTSHLPKLAAETWVWRNNEELKDLLSKIM